MPAERTRNAQPTGPTKTMASTRQALLPYARSPPKVPLTAAKAKKVGIKATGEALIPARKGEDKEDLSIVGTSSVHDRTGLVADCSEQMTSCIREHQLLELRTRLRPARKSLLSRSVPFASRARPGG